MRIRSVALTPALALAVVLSAGMAEGQGICSGTYESEMARFGCMLDEHNNESTAVARAQVASEIASRYQRSVAILVLDLTGFTSAARTFGAVETLAAINGLWATVKQAVVDEAGVILKDEADTFFAVFPLVADAVDGALAAQIVINARNAEVIAQEGVDALRFCGSIGIGFGDVYVIGDEDAFGLEVNYTYDAGENRAEANQILITQSAKNQFAAGTGDGAEIQLALSNKVRSLRRWAVNEESNGLTRHDYALWEVRPRAPTTCVPR